MDAREANFLLTKAGLVDGRQPSVERADAWAEILEEVSFEDGLWALREFHRTSAEWVQPAHLIDLLRARKTREQDAERRRAQIDRAPEQITPLTDQEKEVARLIYENALEEARRIRAERRETLTSVS